MNTIPDELPVLETDRLRLRAMTPIDVADLFAIYGDDEVMRYVSDPPFSEPATVLRMLASVERLLVAGQSLEWGVEDKQTRRLIGTIGLHGFTPSDDSAQVGCMLARVAWGQGYMREALTPVIAYAKDTLRIATLLANIDEPNMRSIRLFVSLGFQRLNNTSYELRL